MGTACGRQDDPRHHHAHAGRKQRGHRLIPSYDQIGVAASALLLCLRLLQGLAHGGESGVSYTYVAEIAHEGAPWPVVQFGLRERHHRRDGCELRSPPR
ncbi:hypothetical protein ACU4GD_17010 [Cupriavidus basilensis]